MNSSLQYTKRLVSFMVFEQEGDKMGDRSSLDEEASMTKMQDMIDDEDNSKIDQDDQQQISA